MKSTLVKAARRGRQSTGTAMTATERSRKARAKVSGRIVTSMLDSQHAAQLDAIKARKGIKSDADAIRFAIECAAQ